MAGRMLQAGKGVWEVARLVGALPGLVSRWKKALEQGGMEALKARPHPGRPPKLSEQQKQELAACAKGPCSRRGLRCRPSASRQSARPSGSVLLTGPGLTQTPSHPFVNGPQGLFQGLERHSSLNMSDEPHIVFLVLG